VGKVGLALVLALLTFAAFAQISLADASGGCDFVPTGTTPACQPPLSPSKFEGGDGNLAVNTTGNNDWANVNPAVGIDLPSGTGDNAFGQGTKEDNPNVTVVDGSIPPNKSDLIRFYESSETISGQTFLYLAWERSNVLGNANMDFEIDQKATSGFDSKFTGPITLNRSPGDLLVTYDFTNGGGQPVLGLNRWIVSATNPTVPGFTANTCFSANSFPCWGDHITLNGTNSEGAVNNYDTVTDPIAPNAPRDLPASTFGETAINLTAAGVFGTNTCTTFATTFLKSRSSSSFTSEVKDFVAPIPTSITNCATVKITKVTLNDPNPGTTSFDYSTTGGLGTGSFSLTGGTGSTSSKTFLNVAAGNYTVTEGTLASGWSLKDLTCTASGGTTQSTSLATATASIGVTGEGEVDCTYTNKFTSSPSIATSLSSTTVNPGDKVHDSATLSNASTDPLPTGTVTYSVYSDNTCSTKATTGSGGQIDAQPAAVTLNADGTVPNSGDVTFQQAGTYFWQAAYSGDSYNNSAKSPCTSEKIVVKTNPTIATVLSESTGNIGDFVSDSSTLSGVTSDAGGTVTYTVYTDNACTTKLSGAGTVTVTNGVVPGSNSVQFSNAGTYYWQAVYSGDTKNNGATSPCTSEKLIIKAGPSIATLLSASTVNIGDKVHDSATLSNASTSPLPSGTVTYTIYSDNTCSTQATTGTSGQIDAQPATVTLNANGSVPDSGAVTFQQAGIYYWQAVYSGDAYNNGATSPCTSEKLVVKTNPSIATQLSASSVAIGTTVHDSATLSNATSDAGGTVTYTVYFDNTCSSVFEGAGTVTVTNGNVPDSSGITFNDAGTYYWQAVYTGDGKNNGATSPCQSEQLVVNPNTPGISTAQNLLPNDSAKISGATSNAGGTLTFELFSPSDATCSGTPAYSQMVNVSGNGTYSTTNTTFLASAEGTWRWLATYSGDKNNVGTTSACGVEQFTIANS
jgi:hypothetical protein